MLNMAPFKPESSGKNRRKERKIFLKNGKIIGEEVFGQIFPSGASKYHPRKANDLVISTEIII